MTGKRFTQKDEDDWEILDRNKHFAYAHSGYQAEKIIQELNELVETNRELYKDNKQLKQGLNDDLELIGQLQEENKQLKNKIDVLEDDNKKYHKSLEQLNLYTKRFIPTKCTNEFKDCKTNRYYCLDHEGNFKGCLELLNLLDCERELLESENRQLKGRLLLYEK